MPCKNNSTSFAVEQQLLARMSSFGVKNTGPVPTVSAHVGYTRGSNSKMTWTADTANLCHITDGLEFDNNKEHHTITIKTPGYYFVYSMVSL